VNDSFYNTINLAARELSEAQENALTQEQRVLRWFIRKGPEYSVAPSRVRRSVFLDTVPITSVRRAMTSLTGRGDLLKSGAMIIGPYGKPEHLWTVAAKWTRSAPKQGELL